MTSVASRIVLVTGLSGAGKATIMHVLEDLGFEAIDNPPLDLLDALAGRGVAKLAIGIDSRTDGFDPMEVIAAAKALRAAAGGRVDLVFATADDAVLLRRFTETRRRHPLARDGRVAEGIASERDLLAPLRNGADLVIDTSALPPGGLRRLVEERLAPGDGTLALTLVSFAFPRGLPPDADLVFDARFLKNPHYDPTLRSLTGRDAPVRAFVAGDPDYAEFAARVFELIKLVLPRFVREGKSYATVAVGCTGGRHRSVTLVEDLARRLGSTGASALSCPDRTVRPAANQIAGIRITLLHRELQPSEPVPDSGTGEPNSPPADAPTPEHAG